MEKLIMELHVKLRENEINAIDNGMQKVVFLPFDGTIDSDIFKGEVLPGGVDVQVTDPSGIRRLCAKYLLKGIDMDGKECSIFVENNGYFEPGSDPMPFRAHPVFITDSKALLPYLSQDRFYAEGHPAEGGVIIKIFDALCED